MGGTIVCGVNASADGHAAAALASALGTRLGLRLVLVSVIDAAPSTDGLTSRQRRNRAEQTLQEIARTLSDEAEARVVLGPRAEALSHVAAEEGADVIVVGSRTAGVGGRKLRSTLARELEAATPVPVLVAPPSTPKRSDRRLAVAGDAKRS